MDVAAGLTAALAFGGQGLEFAETLRAIANVDGQGARIAAVERFEIGRAEGDIGSTVPLQLSFTLRFEFPDVADAGRHTIQIMRAGSGIDIADRIVLRAAEGWTIREDSIRPSNLRAYYRDGEVSGSQSELEGTEPLTFEIEKGGGLSEWIWFGLASLLLLLLGAAIYAWNKRRKV